MRKSRWSREDTDLVRGLVLLGKSRKDILAKIPGLTPRRLSNKLYQMGLATISTSDDPPLSDRSRRRTGLRMGSLSEALSPEHQRRIAAIARQERITVAAAIDRLLARGSAA